MNKKKLHEQIETAPKEELSNGMACKLCMYCKPAVFQEGESSCTRPEGCGLMDNDKYYKPKPLKNVK